MKTIFTSLVLLTLLAIHSNVVADPVKVHGMELVNRFEENGETQYSLLWKELRGLGLEFNLELSSGPRRLRSFMGDDQSCTFPANAKFLHQMSGGALTTKLITALVVDYAGLVALTANGAQKITTRVDLKDKNIGIIGSLSLKPILATLDHASVSWAGNNEMLLQALYKQRVEVILAFMPDILLAAKAKNLPIPHSTDIWIFKKQPVSLLCHDTAKNHLLIEKFNQLLLQLKKSGRLREIMGPYVSLGDGSAEFF